MEELASCQTRDEKLKALAALWVEGARVDWGLLYQDSAPQRISAPTYPFAEERFLGGNCEANGYQTFASVGTSEYICLAGAAVQFGIHGKRVFYCRAYH